MQNCNIINNTIVMTLRNSIKNKDK